MNDDPVVKEIHEIREQLLQEHGGLDGYLAHLRDMQEKMKGRIVSREPRKPVVTTSSTREGASNNPAPGSAGGLKSRLD